MTLLIDGYNLLYASGISGPGIPKGASVHRRSPTHLHRAREALLRFLASSIETEELPRTTIVFDATDAPPGLPRKVDHAGMTVLYASGYVDADTLIEELIQRESAPRSLMVVSSDHRIQRAAARRKASYLDSDLWFGAVCRSRYGNKPPGPSSDEKPRAPLSSGEIDYWLSQFMPDGNPKGEAPERGVPKREANQGESRSDRSQKSGSQERDSYDSGRSIPKTDWSNPFPPGYGEDLLADEEE